MSALLGPGDQRHRVVRAVLRGGAHAPDLNAVHVGVSPTHPSSRRCGVATSRPFSRFALSYLLLIQPVALPLYRDTPVAFVPLALSALILAAVVVSRPATLRMPTNARLLGLFAAFAWSVAVAQIWAGHFQPGAVASLATNVIWLSAGIGVSGLVLREADYRDAQRLVAAAGVALIGSIIVSAVLDQVWGIAYGEIISEGETGGLPRYFGPIGDNATFVLPFFVLWAMASRRWALAGIALLGLIMTGTRGAFVSCAVGVAWLLMRALLHRGMAGRARILGAVAAALVILFASPLGGRIRDLVLSQQRLQSEEVLVGTEERAAAMAVGLRVFSDHPWVGVGFGQYPTRAAPYAAMMITSDDPALVLRGTWNAQNQFVQVVAEAGVIGLGAFVLFAWSLLTRLHTSGVANAGSPAFSEAVRAYAVAAVLGNQSAVWMVLFAPAGYFLLAITAIALGHADRVSGPDSRRIPERRSLVRGR